MTERRFDLPDAGWAFLIGALTGVGAVLLLRGGEDDTDLVIRNLCDQGVRARRMSDRRARELGEIVAVSRRVRSRDGS
jgi:hypothetical protein